MNDSLEVGLGRLAAPDERDNLFLASALFRPENIERKYRSWPAHISSLYQANLPHCVAFSWMHFLVDAPQTHKAIESNAGSATIVIRGTDIQLNTGEFYAECQRNDEWPGEDYAGTSVRSGAKILQSLGLISEYRWAFTVEDMINCILTQGPVIVGTDWYAGMSNPDEKYFMHLTGTHEGGHAYKVDGVNIPSERFRIKNSWSPRWGNRGFAFISFEDMATLLAANGEACIALEA